MKKLLLITVAFLATIVAGATTKEVVFDFAANPWELPLGSGQGETASLGNITEPIVVDGVTLSFEKGTAKDSSPRMWNNKNAGQLRVYNGNVFTVTTEGELKIVKIDFGTTPAMTAEDGTISGTAWTGNVAGVVFSGTGTSKVDKLIVTLSDEGEVVTPDPEPGVDPTPTEGTGAGTLENPYDCVAANSVASQLASDVNTSKEVYIKGIVASVKENFGTKFGNASFYISNDGTAEGQFYVFRALYLNNEKYTEGDLLADGDEVVVCGIITNYMGNTPETVAGKAYLVSLKKGEGGTTDPDPEPGVDPTPTEGTGAGTLENPYDCVAANSVASQLASGVNTSKEVYIKGIVASVKENFGTQYGNASFYISNDGTAEGQFYVYRAFYLNNEKYTEGDLLAAGDEVVVCGIITNYMGNTPETVAGKAYLVSLKKGEGGSTDPDPEPGVDPGVDPEPIEVGKNFIVNSDFETWTDGLPDAWKSATTASNAKLSQSEDAYEGTYAVCVAGDEKNNKRIATKEYTLPAGQYKMSAFVKGAGQVRLGYTIIGEDGKISNTGYKYGEYAATTADDWTEVTNEFELTETTKVNFVMMNPKTSDYAAASDKLVDNFTVVCQSTTGVNEAVNVEGKQVIYDITGRRLAKPVKGINIINGKKVIIK